MTLDEQQNRLLKDYRRYLTLSETEREAFWQHIRTEASEAGESGQQLRQQAVAANLEQIRQRLIDIKQQVERAEKTLPNL